MQAALQAFLIGFPALFSIVNPASAAFIFREVTAGHTHAERLILSRRVATYSLLVMLVALWAGSTVLGFFGISLAALRVAGGLVVMSNAWEILRTPEERHARKQEEANAPDASEDIAFFHSPSAAAAPGTISSIALSAGHPGGGVAFGWFLLGATAAAAAMSVVIWRTFRFADTIVDRLGPTGARTLPGCSPSCCSASAYRFSITGVQDVLRPIIGLNRQPRLDPSGPTRTSTLPKLRPLSIVSSASGAFSSPSVTSSR